MLKEEVLLIRIDRELKEKIKNAANKLGLSLSAYIRMNLIEKLNCL